MSQWKVAVYAICKNEEKFVPGWVKSMSEADDIYVLDTGSDDNTVTLLKEQGVHVKTEVITPWRFDTARNQSLEMVPSDVDICVCTDLDEMFQPGWREHMEQAWEANVKQLKYRYTWNFNEDGSEGSVFWIEKVHARQDFQWVHPVHEVLRYSGSQPHVIVDAPGVQLNHHADNTKSRGQYLKLLELAVREAPDDDRNMHYLGREYMFYGMWTECRETLTKHLAMKSATWCDERCASMRFLARACSHLGLFEEEEQWLLKAIAEAPYMREPWLDASETAARKKDWYGSLYFAQRALAITSRSRSYINDAESWGAKPFDLAAIAAYYGALFSLALDYGTQALKLSPHNQRLKDNLSFYEQAVAAASSPQHIAEKK